MTPINHLLWLPRESPSGSSPKPGRRSFPTYRTSKLAWDSPAEPRTPLRATEPEGPGECPHLDFRQAIASSLFQRRICGSHSWRGWPF